MEVEVPLPSKDHHQVSAHVSILLEKDSCVCGITMNLREGGGAGPETVQDLP